MLLFLLSFMIAYADTGSPTQPHLTITVEDSRYPEIYMEKTKVICSSCAWADDISTLFVAANRHHRTWFKTGTILAIYNSQKVGLRYPECDFQSDTFKCIQENSVWLLRSTITMNDKVASLSLLLIDDSGTVVGQASHIKYTKTQIVNKEKKVSSMGGIPGTGFQANEIEPVVIEIKPTLTDRDVDQTMIMLYDSIR